MSLSLEGYNNSYVTFRAVNGIKPGDLAELVSYNQVQKCRNNNIPVGMCVAVRDNMATVQISGYMSIKFNANPEAVGYITVVADENGGLKIDPKGKYVMLVDYDTVNYKILF